MTLQGTILCLSIAYALLGDLLLLGVTRARLPWTVKAAAIAAFVRVLESVAAAHECEADARFDEGYPATRNDPRAVALVEAVAGDLFGAESYMEMPTPIMGGEDFAYVLQRVPGAMAFIGVAPPGEEAAGRAPLHNSRMTIHEESLQRGVALHCGFATRFLARGWE